MTVVVSGVEIPEAAIAAELQYHPADSREAAWTAAAQALVVRRLLLAEATRQGFWDGDLDAAGPQVDEAIDRLLGEALTMPTADAETCRRFYDQNLKRFRAADLYEAEHILLAAAPDDDAARVAARSRAAEIIALLIESPDLFGALARAESACPSREQGGRLGQFAGGTTVPEFETFLAALEDNQLCPVPVETRYGFHVVRMLRRLPGRQLPFEAVEDRIAADLSGHAWRMAARQYLMRLAGEAGVSGVDLPQADGPLLR